MYHDGRTVPGAVKWRSDRGAGVWCLKNGRRLSAHAPTFDDSNGARGAPYLLS